MPANPYTTTTISGYNASPPPDDGSRVSANKVEWAKHKTKIGDPIKTGVESVDSNANAAFAALVMTTDPAEENVIVAMSQFMQ